MNERRKKMVELAYRVLDSDGSGVVDLNDVKMTYDVSSHPDVVAGRITPEDALLDFLDTFRIAGKRGKNNRPATGGITLDDFCDYYANISASVDSDDYFELMIRNAWHISGGSGWCENTTNRRLLVTHADGRQSVQEIQNDIGVRAKDTDKMMAKLQSQGITDVKNINLTGIEDMKHQVENPQYRANLQKQLDEENRQLWLQEQAQQQQQASSSQQRPNMPMNSRMTPPGSARGNPALNNYSVAGNNMNNSMMNNHNNRLTPPSSARNNTNTALTDININRGGPPVMNAGGVSAGGSGVYSASRGVSVPASSSQARPATVSAMGRPGNAPSGMGGMSTLGNLASFASAQQQQQQQQYGNNNIHSSSNNSVGHGSARGGIPPPVPLAKMLSQR